jgi:hypothetical protein
MCFGRMQKLPRVTDKGSCCGWGVPYGETEGSTPFEQVFNSQAGFERKPRANYLNKLLLMKFNKLSINMMPVDFASGRSATTVETLERLRAILPIFRKGG